jgi:hypothetical protein
MNKENMAYGYNEILLHHKEEREENEQNCKSSC